MAKKPLVVKATEKELNAFEKNHASNENIASRFLEYVATKLTDTRNNRLEMEDQWIDDLRLWSCRLDDLGYVGRSNMFVPELHSQIEQSVEKNMSALFPKSDIVKAIGINGTPQEKADKIRNAVEYELSEKANIYVKHQDFTRCKILYGTSIYKGGFRNETRDIFTRTNDGKVIKDTVPKYMGVTWDTVDLFRWYIYPETGNLLDNEMIFEDQWYPKEDLDEKLYYNLGDISEASFDPNHQWVDAERLEIINIASAGSVRKGNVFLTEIWCDFALDGKNKVPCKAVIANDKTLLRLVRNPFWSQCHPYLAERYVKRPGKLFYGFSLPDKLRSQQYQINDTTNHTMDSLSYSLNPITVVDPGQMGDINSMKFQPGARWFGSPEGIKPIAYPDVTPSGSRIIQEIRGQFAQFSDTQPGMAPQLSGKARSATAVDAVQQSVSQRQRMTSKSEEVSVLGPMCTMTHSLLKQFMDKDWQIKYQGAVDGEWIVEKTTPSDIWGEAEWIWLGASAAEKTAIRSQQLLAFQQQAFQAAQIMGPGEIDLAKLMKMIAKEALDLSGTDMEELFKSLRQKRTVDPEVENTAILMGREITVNYGDDDDEHIRVIDELIQDKSLSEEIRLKAIEHKTAHEEQKFAKEELEQMKARMEAQKQEMAMQDEGGDGREGPAVPSPMEGNNQQGPSSFANMATGVRGTEPNI